MSTVRLEALTETQWQQVYEQRDRWLARGMSTQRADRVAVEAAMIRLYAAKGHPRPLLVWADSPLSAVLMAAVCKDGRLGDQLDGQLRGQLGDRLDGQLRGQLGGQLRGQLDGQLRGQLRGQLDGQLDVQLRGQLEAIYWNTRCSGWDMAWYAYWSIPRDLGRVTYPDDLSTLLDDFATVAYGATSWTPYAGICFLSDRPTAIHMVGTYREARLHRPDGAAIEFADGWTVHAWHGVRVPAWVITGPTPDLIHTEPNVEIRRCAIEKMGWDVYLDRAGLELSPSVDDPGNPGPQLRLSQPVDLFGAARQCRVLLCTNGTVERDGTRRRFGLTTPAHITDPVEAAAWTYGWPRDTYAQLARRT